MNMNTTTPTLNNSTPIRRGSTSNTTTSTMMGIGMTTSEVVPGPNTFSNTRNTHQHARTRTSTVPLSMDMLETNNNMMHKHNMSQGGLGGGLSQGQGTTNTNTNTNTNEALLKSEIQSLRNEIRGSQLQELSSLKEEIHTTNAGIKGIRSEQRKAIYFEREKSKKLEMELQSLRREFKHMRASHSKRQKHLENLIALEQSEVDEY